MIQKAHFRNFMALRHLDLDLEPLTVLVGPNASGKTSVLEGMDFLARLSDLPPEDVFQGPRHPALLYSRNAEGPMELSSRAANGEFRLRLTPPPPSAYDDLQLAVSVPLAAWGPEVARRLAHQEDGWTPLQLRGRTPGGGGAPSVLRFAPDRLAAPSYSPHPRPRLGPDGEGLASCLAHIRLNHPDDFESLQGMLRLVVPQVRRIRFERAPIVRPETETIIIGGQKYPHRVDREYWGDALILDFAGADDVPAHMASEGTLVVLGLLALLMGPGRPNLVLWDDMDRGLHPKAQKHLIAILRDFLQKVPELQVVATTHSPYLLDELRPEEVRITGFKPDDSVACARLIEHPQFEKWKKEMTPGEFWSLIGEKWVGDRQAVESR
jgi:hypothetical protein